MADFDCNQAVGAGESEKTRIVKRLRELAAGAETTPKDVVAVVEELPDHPARADVIGKCYGPSKLYGQVVLRTVDDALRVSIRLLARLIESGEVDLGEHADWTDEDIAKEAAPWPGELRAAVTVVGDESYRQLSGPEVRQSAGRQSTTIAPGVIYVPPDAVSEEPDERLVLPEAEELDDADLLRALADNLTGSKHPLHRTAVARLYEIADLIEEPPTPNVEALALRYIELEARMRVLEDEKLKNTVARGRIEQEVDNLVTGTAFMGDRVQTHHQEIGALDGRIDTLTERLEVIEVREATEGVMLTERLEVIESKKFQDQIDAITEASVPGLEDKIDRALKSISELKERALTAEELATIRVGLAEEPAPVEEESLVCVHQSRNLGACCGVVRQAEPGPLCEEHYTLWSGSSPPTFGSR